MPNIGAFGEGFPYSNFHDMNLNWIIKIAKDFLDQYSTLQQTITDGMEGLENKATELEALLQEWYNTHSEDIANELADALSDLNDWYTTHQNYLNQTLIQKENEFATYADQKAQETLESIPSDYTTTSNGVTELKRTIGNTKHPADNIVEYMVANTGGYYDETGTFNESATIGYSNLIKCEPNTLYSINIPNGEYFNFLDENQDFISGSVGTYAVSPSTAYYIRISALLSRFAEMILTKHSLYYNKLEDTKKNKTYLTEEALVTSDTTVWQTLTTDWDFSQPAYIRLTNNGENAQIVDVAVYQNSTVRQVFHVTIPAYDSVEQELIYANTAGVDSWMGENQYFTNYTWGIKVANPSGVKYISASVYTKDDESPIHKELPYVNCVLVNTSGTKAFKSIIDAIAYAKKKFNVTTTPATIYIERGIYEFDPVTTRPCVIVKGANKLSLIGEDRDTTKIILHSTPSHNNKVIEHGGDSKIANLTIENLWTDDGTPINYTNNSYCLHIDTAFTSEEKYNTTVENCFIYSEAFAPIGAGLHKNQNQKYINSTIIFNCADDNSSTGYNQWAPIYIHTPNTSGDEENCSVEIDNCNCYALSGTYAIALPFNASGTGHTTFADIPVTIQRTIGTTTGEHITDIGSQHDIQPQSALNNVSAWNY